MATAHAALPDKHPSPFALLAQERVGFGAAYPDRGTVWQRRGATPNIDRRGQIAFRD